MRAIWKGSIAFGLVHIPVNLYPATETQGINSNLLPMDELRLPVNEKLAPNEVNLAMKLIEGMTADFDPAKYHDTYTEDVKKLIDAKAKGQKRQAPLPKPVRSNVIDIVAALQESLARKKPRKRGAA